MTILTIGEKLIDVELQDLEGDRIKLSDLNNKFILLSFWSLTCMVCMKAAREMGDLHKKYKDKINIVSINMDTEKSMWEQGSNRDKITWTNLSDGKGIFDGIGKKYGIINYPAYVLINTNGIIVDRWMGHKPGRLGEKFKYYLG